MPVMSSGGTCPSPELSKASELHRRIAAPAYTNAERFMPHTIAGITAPAQARQLSLFKGTNPFGLTSEFRKTTIQG